MASFFAPPRPSLEEAKAIRESRKLFSQQITTASTTATAALKAKTMTPDTAKAINNVISDTRAWLSKNPNASYDEIGAKYDEFVSKITELRDSDAPRIVVLTAIQSLSFNADAAQQQGIINAKQNAALKQYQKKQQAWFDKNAMKSSDLGLVEKLQEIIDKQAEIVQNPQFMQTVSEKAATPEAAKAAIAEQKKIETLKKEQPVTDIKSGAKYASEIAGQVIGSFLLIVLCGISASLAANSAIGRPPAYRLLYFIYGLVPIFAPFVLFYALLKRMNKGPQPWYGILPVSITPAVTNLGKFLWFPFYWVPDQRAVDAAKEWIESLEKVADVVKKNAEVVNNAVNTVVNNA
jgi:hypothetical protein